MSKEAAATTKKARSQAAEVWRQFRRNKGAVAGYFGGAIEEIIMRSTDILSAVPNMLMAIVIVSVLGQSIWNLMFAVGITSVPQFVRITRAAVLTVRNQEYVEASKAIGLNNRKIIFRHILPNCLLHPD